MSLFVDDFGDVLVMSTETANCCFPQKRLYVSNLHTSVYCVAFSTCIIHQCFQDTVSISTAFINGRCHFVSEKIMVCSGIKNRDFQLTLELPDMWRQLERSVPKLCMNFCSRTRTQCSTYVRR